MSDTPNAPMRLAFYPAFDTEAQLQDHVCRAAWYLGPLQDQLAAVTMHGPAGARPPVQALPLLDPGLPALVGAFKVLALASGAPDWDSTLAQADAVFLHDDRVRSELQERLRRVKPGTRIVRVDHERVQHADSFYLRFAAAFPALQAGFRAHGAALCRALLPPLRREKCYLFGTGPNFSLSAHADFSDGVVVACNSMVINHQVVDRLNPAVFVIADPIFHAGPSIYAAKFRAAFVQEMRGRDCPVFVPLRDYHVYRACLQAELLDRVIPIAFDEAPDPAAPPNLDLLADPLVTVTSNILTLFQIPIAATLARRIFIAGCDGRPSTQNSYFWQHDKSVQINDGMAEIRAAHPAFFAISYDDYYARHESTLARWVAAAEARGCEVVSLTPSFLQPLQSRMRPDLLAGLRAARRRCRLSVIIPMYNAREFVVEAIASLQADAVDDMEIIVVDDYSEDGSPDLVRQVADTDPRVFLIQNFCGKGVSGARNTGLALANGDVVTFLDADDTIVPGSLRARLEALERDPSISMVHGHRRFIDRHGRDLGADVGTRRRITFRDASGNPTSFNTLMLRREVAAQLHFDEGLTNGEDWLALAELLRRGHASEYVAAGGATYRIHGGSTVIRDMVGHEQRLRPVIDWLYAPSDAPGIAPAYRAGLAEPSQNSLLLGRDFNALIWQVLTGDVDALRRRVDAGGLDRLFASVESDCEGRLRVSGLRCFERHVDAMASLEPGAKRRIRAAASVLRDLPCAQGFLEKLHAVFGLDGQPLPQRGDLGRANRLYRENRIDEALALYEALLASHPFYRFLEFNVACCRHALEAAARAS